MESIIERCLRKEYSFEGAKNALQKVLILRALEATSWHVTKAAVLLGIHRSTLQMMLKRFGIKELKRDDEKMKQTEILISEDIPLFSKGTKILITDLPYGEKHIHSDAINIAKSYGRAIDIVEHVSLWQNSAQYRNLGGGVFWTGSKNPMSYRDNNDDAWFFSSVDGSVFCKYEDGSYSGIRCLAII